MKCVPQPKIAKKNNKTPYFGNSGSFKIIDVNTTEKLVTIACCEGIMSMANCNRFHATDWPTAVK